MQQVTPELGFSLSAFLSALAGWGGGAVTTILLFRSRLDVAAAKFEALERRLAEQRQNDKERLDESLRDMRRSFDQQCAGLGRSVDQIGTAFEAWTREARSSLGKGMSDSARREEFLLELVLGIAHKNGVRHRFSDALVHIARDVDDETKRG